MTDTASLLEDLFAECNTVGIRLLPAGDGGLTIDAPKDALTHDLLARLQAHKIELLAILWRDPEAPAIDLTDATQVWQAALDQLDGDPLFPPDILAGLRAAGVRWASELPNSDHTEWPRINTKPEP